MTAPRLEIDLNKIQHNARTLVRRLAGKGIHTNFLFAQPVTS